MTHAGTPETGLVIVAHGERNTSTGNRTLLAHAARVAVRWPRIFVQAAVLYGEPSLKRAWKAAAERGVRDLLLYPFFMTDGYIVEQLLARRILSSPDLNVTLMPPLGLDPRLPSLLLEESLRAADAAGYLPDETQLLVAAHGSRLAKDASAAIAQIAAALQSHNVFADAKPAYLDHRPLLREALENRERPMVVAGCFAGEGAHARRDVPTAIARAGTNAAYTGPIGAHPEVTDLIIDAFAEKLGQPWFAAIGQDPSSGTRIGLQPSRCGPRG